jgi:sec-independent protein translocase protein TatB
MPYHLACMPSFSDSIFLFILALLLFGPKKLPVLAREIGKWVGEFRRASNEFKMQMEEELRQSEQADRQKQIAAMEAAAPVTPAIAEPEHPHLAIPSETSSEETHAAVTHDGETASTEHLAETTESPKPLPIATSGELNIMPPSTGLPVPQTRNTDALGGLLESIPVTEEHQPQSETQAAEPAAETVSPEMLEYARESASHGD